MGLHKQEEILKKKLKFWSQTYKSLRLLRVMQQFIGDWISYQFPKLIGWFSRNLYKERRKFRQG